MATYIGIDPGKSGAYAFVRECDGRRDAWASPWDEDAFIAAMQSVRDDVVYVMLERVNAFPGQGVTSMFHFGANYGFIQGVLRAYAMPFETVPPTVWKKSYSLGKDKTASVETARCLFPGVNLKRTQASRKDDDGMAEALLLAEYGRKRYVRE